MEIRIEKLLVTYVPKANLYLVVSFSAEGNVVVCSTRYFVEALHEAVVFASKVCCPIFDDDGIEYFYLEVEQ